MCKKGLFGPNWKNNVERALELRGYSRKTKSSYLYWLKRFRNHEKSPEDFLIYLSEKGLSSASIRQAGFAIKFYLQLENRKVDIPNYKRDKTLPVILSKKEINSMILSTNNIKHRTMIKVLYGAGLRLGELINLKWQDVDFKRNTIHIRSAKGRKDRMVMLSPKLKKSLKGLSSPGAGNIFQTKRRNKYSSRTIQSIVSNLAKKAGINKKVSPHTLRHSFATHLLENGTDMRYISDLLGHSNVRTTMIYTHVSNRDISRIKSPLDL